MEFLYNFYVLSRYRNSYGNDKYMMSWRNKCFPQNSSHLVNGIPGLSP